MGDIKSIGFNLIRVSTEQFAIIAEPPDSVDNVLVTTKIRFGVDFDLRLVGVFTQISFCNSENTPFLLIEGGCHFQIAPDDWEATINKETKTVEFPKDFAVHMLMLCIGTTRGILHAKTENSTLNKFHIPLIDATKLVEKDLVFQLSV